MGAELCRSCRILQCFPPLPCCSLWLSSTNLLLSRSCEVGTCQAQSYTLFSFSTCFLPLCQMPSTDGKVHTNQSPCAALHSLSEWVQLLTQQSHKLPEVISNPYAKPMISASKRFFSQFSHYTNVIRTQLPGPNLGILHH